MSHPTTRAKNASQHPGHILLEGKQKRRTSEQKQADDVEAERAWEEQEAAWERGIQRLVNIIDSSIQEEESQLTNPPKPKPRLCLIIKDPSQDSADMTKSVFGDDDRVESDMIDSQGGGERLVDGGEELDNELEGSLNEAAQKIADWHSMDSQKWKPDSSQYAVFPSLSMLTMMILLTETILFYWDCIDSSLEADKSKYSGIGEVVDWADKLASSKPLHTLISQRSASNSHYAWTNAMAITDVVSGSELNESAPSPLPPSQYMHSQWGCSSSDARKALRNEDDYIKLSGDEIDDGGILLVEMKRGTKRDPRSRTQHTSSGQGSQRSGSGANKKFINSDLPLGATNDNAWRRLFISALAYFAAGYDNPWTIPDDKLQHVLQEIWDIVYWDKVVHTVVIGGPVYSLAKQGLSNWCTRFAAAAVVVITTFFAHDVDFEDSTPHMEFADAMLKKNRFLFSQNSISKPTFFLLHLYLQQTNRQSVHQSKPSQSVISTCSSITEIRKQVSQNTLGDSARPPTNKPTSAPPLAYPPPASVFQLGSDGVLNVLRKQIKPLRHALYVLLLRLGQVGLELQLLLCDLPRCIGDTAFFCPILSEPGIPEIKYRIRMRYHTYRQRSQLCRGIWTSGGWHS
ncbi:hypothetical protein EDD15DRAFT_2200331 [Pisolithus albus]|nr:hypothetical protein EDD15DRAFT_2200331 [Pisolithus albus]